MIFIIFVSREIIPIDSIFWFNFSTVLSSINSKLNLSYSQFISSQLTCIISNCFTRLIIHIRTKDFSKSVLPMDHSDKIPNWNEVDRLKAEEIRDKQYVEELQ